VKERTRLEVAIVGAGLMGQWHARYAVAAGERVAAVVDQRRQRAAELARRFAGARCFESLDECLRAVPSDVVHVCTDGDHAPVSEQALAAGRHVLVEKPAARSAAAARRLVEVAAQRNVRLCAVHQFGFQRGFRELLARRDRLGAIVRIAGVVCTAGGAGGSDLERREILLGITPHFLSLFRILAGPVGALSWQVLVSTPDDLELSARQADTQLSLSLSVRGRPPRNELVVVGTQATARLDLFHGYCVFEHRQGSRRDKVLAPFRLGAGVIAGAALNLAERALRAEPAFPGLRELIAAFYRSVRDGGDPPIPTDELLESAALFERVAISWPAGA